MLGAEPSSTQLKWIFGHRHEQRALESKRDTSRSGIEVAHDSIDGFGDLSPIISLAFNGAMFGIEASPPEITRCDGSDVGGADDWSTGGSYDDQQFKALSCDMNGATPQLEFMLLQRCADKPRLGAHQPGARG